MGAPLTSTIEWRTGEPPEGEQILVLSGTDRWPDISVVVCYSHQYNKTLSVDTFNPGSSDGNGEMDPKEIIAWAQLPSPREVFDSIKTNAKIN